MDFNRREVVGEYMKSCGIPVKHTDVSNDKDNFMQLLKRDFRHLL